MTGGDNLSPPLRKGESMKSEDFFRVMMLILLCAYGVIMVTGLWIMRDIESRLVEIENQAELIEENQQELALGIGGSITIKTHARKG